MRIIFLFTVLITVSAFTFKPDHKRIVGSWKVDKVVLSNGAVKDGRKILTFSSDNSFVSEKDNGRTIDGTWEFTTYGDSLTLCRDSGRSCETFEIVEFSRKELILKDRRKTYYTSKK